MGQAPWIAALFLGLSSLPPSAVHVAPDDFSPAAASPSGCEDSDGDGRCNGEDNCPYIPNPDQADLDGFAERVIAAVPVVLDPRSAHAADIDGDGDLDIVSVSAADDKVAWYENLDGTGSFGPSA